MFFCKNFIIIFLCFALNPCAIADSDSLVPRQHRGRKVAVFSTELLLYGGTYVVLGKLWYQNYQTSSFHLFDDSHEWLQMDKVGHAYSAFWITRANYQVFSWAGYNHRQSVLLSSASSWLFISTIEVFDGMSAHWGASLSDLCANTAGVALASIQKLATGGEPVLLKYSYYPSPYAKMRPDELGENTTQRLLKDYNAQTFWASCGVRTLTGWKRVPRWLNIAIGYGADGMTGGSRNEPGTVAQSQRRRQYYLSLDVNLEAIKTRSKFFNSLLWTANCIKIPFLAFEYTGGNGKMVIR